MRLVTLKRLKTFCLNLFWFIVNPALGIEKERFYCFNNCYSYLFLQSQFFQMTFFSFFRMNCIKKIPSFLYVNYLVFLFFNTSGFHFFRRHRVKEDQSL